MSKMNIYFYLLIPLFCLSAVDSSSIRGRNSRNDLVSQTGSRLDRPGKTHAPERVVAEEPLFVQIQLPKGTDGRGTPGRDKKKNGQAKKRVSKLKTLRKKHRTRRDLLTLKSKHAREEKSHKSDIPLSGDRTERQIKNQTKNTISRTEILKALSSPSKERQEGRNGFEKVSENDKRNNRGKHATVHRHSLPEQTPSVKMVYPTTPSNRITQKYTEKDLIEDRKRLEQKINYIKNMLKANDSSAADDGIRIRRKSESDRNANKIAKMFLTLSAVNSLHDKRKSKSKADDEDDNRAGGGFEKERRSPVRRTSSSNAERYKVKKWIEFMKSKRSSGKTCPCMRAVHDDDGDAFPLEQNLQRDLILVEETGREEDFPETYRDSRDKSNRWKADRESDCQGNKLKSVARNGKKKLELPLSDLELYRSRAKQILQNAEEILDRIKEEEERRLSAPNILMSQLKELTSRIQSDPRSNENDLIRKVQKNLGWNPLTKSTEGSDGNGFIDNVKSYIVDSQGKAKALTDESAKKLSSYLLRNLGKIDSSKEGDGEPSDLQVYFGEVPVKAEDKPVLENLAKEEVRPDLLSKNKQELQNWEDTLSTIMQGPEEAIRREEDAASKQEEIFKSRMEDMMKEQQKKLNEYELSPHSEEESSEMDGSLIRSEKTREPTAEDETAMPLERKAEEETEPAGETSEGSDYAVGMEQHQEELLRRENDVNDVTNQSTIDAAVGTVSENAEGKAEHVMKDPGEDTVGEKHAQEEDEQQRSLDVSGKDSETDNDREETDVLSSPHHLPAEIEVGPERVKETPYDWSKLGTYDETPDGSFTGAGNPIDPAETLLQELDELESEIEKKEQELESEAKLAAEDIKRPVEPARGDIVSLTDSTNWGEKQEVGTKTDDAETRPDDPNLVQEVSPMSEESAEDKTEPTLAEHNPDKETESDEQVEEEADEENLKSVRQHEEKVAEIERTDDEAVVNKEDDAGKVEVVGSDPNTENREEGEDSKSSENDDQDQTLLQAAKADDREDTSEDVSDESPRVEAALENGGEEIVKDGTTSGEKPKEATDDGPVDGGEAVLMETNSTPLTEAVDSHTDPEHVEEVLKTSSSFEEDVPEVENSVEDSDETPLQSKNDGEDLENAEETLQAVNPGQDGQRSAEDSYEALPTPQGEEDDEKPFLESANPVEGAINTQGNQKDETDSSDETSEEVEMSRQDEQNLHETPRSSADPKSEASDESISRETSLQSGSSGESRENLQEARKETVEEESQETSEEKSGEVLKAALENENPHADESSPKPAETDVTDSQDETLKAVLDDGEREKSRDDGVAKEADEHVEQSEDETELKPTPDQLLVETPREAKLEESDEEETDGETPLRATSDEENPKEDSQNGNETVLGMEKEKTEDDDEQFEESTRNEEESEESEETPLGASSDETLWRNLIQGRGIDQIENQEIDPETKENGNENESYSEKEETPLKSAEEVSSIGETPLRATHEETPEPETPTAEDIPDDSHNQIEQNEDETGLQSARFETVHENLDETVREENQVGNLIVEEKSPRPENELARSPLPDLLQMSDSKVGKLKVPKSIGDIMRDLDGKDDVTSIENLNPDKIDDIIDKIDEAEHRNQLESQEVDCRKECACADDIDTRSRKIGRYEIVKDFLHWMKDLQLNRVLGDD